MTPSRVGASAPGKVVILGEYAVLEGAPALVMALPVRAVARAQAIGGLVSTLDAPELCVRGRKFAFGPTGLTWEPPLAAPERRALSVLEAVLQDIARRATGTLPACVLATDTHGFVSPAGVKLGLGSSAAVAVASWAALYVLAGHQVPRAEDALAAVVELHRSAQGGVGSGADVAAACLGGVLVYRLDLQRSGVPQWRRVTLPPQLHLLAVHTGAAASTEQLVRQVRGLALRDEMAYQSLLAGLGELAQMGCQAAEQGNAASLVAAAKAYALRVEELGRVSGVDIFSHAHRHVKVMVERLGAVYKPAGAGGGDIGLALTLDADVAARVQAVAATNGLWATELVAETRGLEVQQHN